MITIEFGNEKGGVGKTTLSTLLAGYLAAVHPLRVLMVDLDPQAHATISFGIPETPALYEVMVRDGDIPDHIAVPHPETISPNGTLKGQLHVLPGNSETFAIPNMVSDNHALAEKFEDVEEYYDIVVIDTNPSAGMLLAQAHMASDFIVIPTQLENLSVHGLVRTIGVSAKAGVDLLGIVPNMVKHTSLHGLYFDQLMDAAKERGWHVFDGIYHRTEWAEASHMRRQIYSITDGPMSKARAEALGLVRAIEGLLING